jgi:hypothetical protein
MFLLKFKYNSAIAVTMGFLLLAGCAGTPGKSLKIGYDQQCDAGKWSDKKLEEQFREYWFKRFSGQIEDAYNMESPSFRELVSLPKYGNVVRNTSRSKLTGIVIHDIQKVSEYLMKIDYEMHLETGDAKPTEVSVADRWVFVDEKWYHVLRDPFFSL